MLEGGLSKRAMVMQMMQGQASHIHGRTEPIEKKYGLHQDRAMKDECMPEQIKYASHKLKTLSKREKKEVYRFDEFSGKPALEMRESEARTTQLTRVGCTEKIRNFCTKACGNSERNCPGWHGCIWASRAGKDRSRRSLNGA
ncbi:hypothetical protein KI387_017861, partial [Taxus chinensis]